MNISALRWKCPLRCFLKIKWTLCCFSDNIPAFIEFTEVVRYESVLAIFMTFIKTAMIFHMGWSFFISFFTLVAHFLHPLPQFSALLTFTHYLKCCLQPLSLQIQAAEADQHSVVIPIDGLWHTQLSTENMNQSQTVKCKLLLELACIKLLILTTCRSIGISQHLVLNYHQRI